MMITVTNFAVELFKLLNYMQLEITVEDDLSSLDWVNMFLEW